MFRPDSRFMIITNTILDYAKLGLLFLLFSIPVVTFGASLTAGFTVAMRIARGEAPAIWKPFLKAFRENFGQATRCNLLVLLVFGLLTFAWYEAMQMERTVLVRVITALIVLLTLLLIIIVLYLFAILARFELSGRAALHNAVIYTILYFPKNLVAPALEFFYFGTLCVKIFRKAEGNSEDAEEPEETEQES